MIARALGVCIASGLLTAGAVHAQTAITNTAVQPSAGAAPLLTLAQADAIALKNHPQILAAQAVTLQSEQVIREQQSAYYPALNGEITGSEANPNARIGAGFLTDSRLFTRFGYGISLSQLVTDSGRTPNLIASSRLQAEARKQDALAVRDDVLLAVHQAYFGVQLSESLVRVADQTVKARQSVLDRISELTRNKLRSDVDLRFAQANLSDAQLMLLRARNNLAGAYAELNRALGSSESVEYQLATESLPDVPPSDAAPLVQTAFARRPELASVRLQNESDLKFAAAERDLKRPVVTINAVAGFLPLINPGTANPDIPAEYQGAALNVQIPIFNGHLFSARAQAAAYQAQASSQRIRSLQEQIARDVRTAQGRAETAHQAIAASEALITQANSALDLAQARYDLGLASIVELTQAQLLQTQAQVGLLNAQFEYQQAYAALQYEQGLLH